MNQFLTEEFDYLFAESVTSKPFDKNYFKEDNGKVSFFFFSFGNKTTVIIDCFEAFCVKPTTDLVRAQTFSSYEHHNTVKVLIGITPQ